MQFPKEWFELDMFLEDFADFYIARYELGQEESSEHTRSGAFHWWLKRNPSKEQLIKLARLTFVDPDPLMAADVRSYIAKADNCDKEVIAFMQEKTDL